MPDNGVILVFTDEPSVQLELESAITAKAKRKNVKVFFALLGDPGSKSEQVYKRVSEGRMFRCTAGKLQDCKAATLAFINGRSQKKRLAFFDAVLRTLRSL